jgi:Fe-S oxidoreductase
MANDPRANQSAEAPRDRGFDYGGHFGTMRTIGEVVRNRSEQPWLTITPRQPEHHRYVVWLGCNMLRTAQIAETLNDVMKALGVDFTMLGGTSSCCGAVHRLHGDVELAANMLETTVRKFDVFTPERLLNWCPDCDNSLRLAPQDQLSETARNRVSVTVFLASQIDKFDLKPIDPIKIALHGHLGLPEQDEDDGAAHLLLSRIPGVEVVEVPGSCEHFRHCSDPSVNRYGKPVYKEMVRNWIADARRQGAERIVSIYHSCHRNLIRAQADLATEEQMGVTNYLTLLARSLRLPEREDNFARLAALPNVEARLEDVTARVPDLRIDPARVRRSLKEQFG